MKKTWHKGKGEGEEEEDCEPCQALKMFKKALPLAQQTQHTQAQQTQTQQTKQTQHPTTPQTQTTTPQFKSTALLEAPPDLQELGRSTWTLLHTIAAYYPERPSDAKKESVGSFITDISKIFPCHECASDFQQVLQDSPPKLDNRYPAIISLYLSILFMYSHPFCAGIPISLNFTYLSSFL
jgi:FAD-linked sulfhydryl oxidase